MMKVVKLGWDPKRQVIPAVMNDNHWWNTEKPNPYSDQGCLKHNRTCDKGDEIGEYELDWVSIESHDAEWRLELVVLFVDMFVKKTSVEEPARENSLTENRKHKHM